MKLEAEKVGSRLVVTALGVGHGDATLVEWFSKERSDGAPFRCLVDGGESPRVLKDSLDRRRVSQIDLLVVSHFDTDHIGGLRDIATERLVETYWSPCLPAFERHLWLFGDRIRDGIERARSLESSLVGKGTNIVYPLEGFASANYGQAGPILRILSPAARIMRTLLVKDDIEWLVEQTPTPLGWLAEPEEQPVDQPANLNALDEQLLSCALSPGDLRWVAPVSPTRDGEPLRREWSGQKGLDPDFFGDSVLNNTSIVLWIDAPGQSRRSRLLLTGDQENWTYLLLKHPFGMQADILKAPHHGGSLYIERDASHEEIFSAVRPSAVLFSANGRHGLPHTKTRETAIRWGASVCCTSTRGVEYIAGSRKNENACCHSAFACDGSRDVSITLNEDGLFSDSPACHSGFGNAPGPVIQIRQHVIEGSPVVQHLFEQELRKNIEWVKERLRELHAQRVSATKPFTTGSEVISNEQLAALSRSSNRHGLAYHLETVLSKGWERRRLWCSRTTYGYRGNPVGAYTIPTESEIEQYVLALRRKSLLLFTFEDYGKQTRSCDRATIINSVERGELAKFCDAVLHFPTAIFDETIWPSVAKELANNWRCYRHSSGAIGLSRSRSARELCRRLMRRCYELRTEQQYWRVEPTVGVEYYILKEEYQREWTSQIIVTQCAKSHKSWHEHWFYTGEDLKRVKPTMLMAAAESLAGHLERLW